MKRLLVFVPVVVALLAGCTPAEPSAPRRFSTPRFSSPAPAATSVAPTCPSSGVRLEAGEVDAAMGLRGLGIGLINCSGQPYRVTGYPAVQALDENRSALPIRVLKGVTEIAGALPNWSAPPAPVLLAPGERAMAIVVWRNTYDDITAPPVNAPYLDMAPEPGRPSQVLAPEAGLDLGSTGRLGVSPWRPDPALPAPTRSVRTGSTPTPTTAVPTTSPPPLP